VPPHIKRLACDLVDLSALVEKCRPDRDEWVIVGKMDCLGCAQASVMS